MSAAKSGAGVAKSRISLRSSGLRSQQTSVAGTEARIYSSFRGASHDQHSHVLFNAYAAADRLHPGIGRGAEGVEPRLAIRRIGKARPFVAIPWPSEAKSGVSVAKVPDVACAHPGWVS